MKILIKFLKIFIIFRYIDVTLSCNGVGMILTSLRNCPGVNSIIKLNNANITLNNDCFLNPRGQRDIIRDYKTAQVKLSVVTKARPVQLRFDACKPITNTLISKLFIMFAIPTNCPVKKGKENLKTRQDVNYAKQTLQFLLGSTYFKIEADHDNGNSCFEGNYTLFKK